MNDVDIALAALADPTRRQVIELLIGAPHRTNELAEAIGVSVPAVSRHLRLLRERGLVTRVDVDGDGRGREYRIDPDRLAVLADWLSDTHWSDTLAGGGDGPDHAELLQRVGRFLDGFAHSDTDVFERHLADDVELVFPGSRQRWDKAATVASVTGHPPYVSWDISDSSFRALGPGITLVVMTVAVRTTAGNSAAPVVQSMVFDDTRDPWTLRFLQQTSA